MRLVSRIVQNRLQMVEMSEGKSKRIFDLAAVEHRFVKSAAKHLQTAWS